jgi:hypothetical protein
MQYHQILFDSAAAHAALARRSPGSEPMDRRQHDRYELQANARFSWKDTGGARWRGRGLTRDISEAGVFVVTRDAPPSGTPVRLEVQACSAAGSGVLVRTKGQVVRVEVNEQPASGLGFAIVTRSLVLRSCKPERAAPNGRQKVPSKRRLKALPGRSRKTN